MAKEEKIKILTTERPEGPDHKSTLRTPSGELNVEVVTQSWWAQVLIRVVRTYLQTVVGLLLGAGFGVAAAHAAEVVVPDMPAKGFIVLLLAAMSAAIGPAVVCLIHNAIEILTKLDVTNPELRA